jgi:glutathione synthase/RimK-type ligase-like ATP-grasp enzyme
MVKLYPYNSASQSAKALTQALGIKRLKREGKLFMSSDLLNWGCSEFKRPARFDRVFNHPRSVSTASNKLQAFKSLQLGVAIPSFTESKEEAFKWLAEGLFKKVVCRTILNGHSGAGIVIASSPDELVDAPLYVEYVFKKHEYRVHATQKGAFFVQQKKKRDGVEDANFQIRNHQNGFIYAHKDVDVPDFVKKMACDAIINLGLDFGAVDIIYNEKNNRWVVLEVNTAPGLSGETLNRYVEMIKELVK